MTVTKFEVPSNTVAGRTYVVSFDDDSQKWDCTCPFIPRRGGNPQFCTHIWDKQADVVAGKEILPEVEPASLDEAFGAFTSPGTVHNHDMGSTPPVAATSATPVLQPQDLVNESDHGPSQQEREEYERFRHESERRVLAKAELEYAAAIEEAPAAEFEVTDVETAMLAVYRDVAFVQKTKTQGLTYSFAGESAILAALRPSMARHGLTARVTKVRNVVTREYESKGGSSMTNVALDLRVTFTHAISRSLVHCWARGEGSDSGDKATPKAMTGAFKYCFRQTFALETGDDPDQYASRDTERAGPSDRETRQARRDSLSRAGAPGDTPPWWQWFIKERNGHGLTGGDLEPVLGGKKCTPASVIEWLAAQEPPPMTDEETANTLQKLLSRAVDRKQANR